MDRTTLGPGADAPTQLFGETKKKFQLFVTLILILLCVTAIVERTFFIMKFFKIDG